MHAFASSAELAAALADQTARRLVEGIETNGAAHLVVSGGRTPIQFFGELSQRDLDWSKVEVILADERWLPADTPRSNAALVRRHLLRGRARSAGFTPLFSSEQSAQDVAQTLSKELGEGEKPFDAVILGMGSDGHTASLFPDAPQTTLALSDRADAVMVLTPVSQPEVRLSLSAKALLNTEFLALHIEGAEKRVVLERALEDGPAEEMPVRSILRNDIRQVQVYWCP